MKPPTCDACATEGIEAPAAVRCGGCLRRLCREHYESSVEIDQRLRETGRTSALCGDCKRIAMGEVPGALEREADVEEHCDRCNQEMGGKRLILCPGCTRFLCQDCYEAEPNIDEWLKNNGCTVCLSFCKDCKETVRASRTPKCVRCGSLVGCDCEYLG